jgi:hypothetical protein
VKHVKLLKEVYHKRGYIKSTFFPASLKLQTWMQCENLTKYLTNVTYIRSIITIRTILIDNYGQEVVKWVHRLHDFRS